MLATASRRKFFRKLLKLVPSAYGRPASANHCTSSGVVRAASCRPCPVREVFLALVQRPDADRQRAEVEQVVEQRPPASSRRPSCLSALRRRPGRLQVNQQLDRLAVDQLVRPGEARRPVRRSASCGRAGRLALADEAYSCRTRSFSSFCSVGELRERELLQRPSSSGCVLRRRRRGPGPAAAAKAAFGSFSASAFVLPLGHRLALDRRCGRRSGGTRSSLPRCGQAASTAFGSALPWNVSSSWRSSRSFGAVRCREVRRGGRFRCRCSVTRYSAAWVLRPPMVKYIAPSSPMTASVRLSGLLRALAWSGPWGRRSSPTCAV